MSQFSTAWLHAYQTRSRTKLPDAQPCERETPLACNSPREAQGAGCPFVRFTLLRVSLLDVDAKYASVKDLLDGLQRAQLIHGDKEGQVRLEVEQVKVSHYHEEKTIIEIECHDNPNL
jgi:hypothetical protein